MLAESGAYQAVYLNDLTIFYLRCRFACNSLPLRNLRLLWICADLLLPAKAALLGLAAICALSIAVDYTAPKQDSRAAADNRSRGKSYSRTNGGERQQYRHAGSCIPEAKSPFEPKTANLSLSLGVPKGPFSFAKENGPFDSLPHGVGNNDAALPRCDKNPAARGGRKKRQPFGCRFFQSTVRMKDVDPF